MPTQKAVRQVLKLGIRLAWSRRIRRNRLFLEYLVDALNKYADDRTFTSNLSKLSEIPIHVILLYLVTYGIVITWFEIQTLTCTSLFLQIYQKYGSQGDFIGINQLGMTAFDKHEVKYYFVTSLLETVFVSILDFILCKYLP